MALNESAVSDLLDALTVGEGVDLVRELAAWALQQLIEAEAAEAIGAELWERTAERLTHRNGHRRRVLSTKAGDLEVGIPKFRKGSFFPEILEPRRRIDQALYAVVMEAYVNGISTRAVDDLVVAMGVDTGISKSEVSRICAGLDARVGAFRNRTLGHVAFAKRVGPHTLRHAFITAALDAEVPPARRVQEAARHADPRTTMRDDRGQVSLDRHAT
jgi:putative transposase